MWLRHMVVLALCGASGLATAEGIQCDKAVNSVDRAICHSRTLPALDAKLGHAYADAAQRAGANQDGLLRDQRHWLAERNELIGASMNDPSSPAASPSIRTSTEKELARFYEDRIAYLSHVFRNDNGGSPLLLAIADRLSKNTGQGYPDDVWKSLGGDGSVFHAPREEQTDAKHVGAKIPVDAGTALTSIIKEVAPEGDDSQLSLVMLPDLGTGGINQMGGTLHCVDWSLFTWHGRTIHALETPAILQQNCWTTWGTMVEFQGKVHALTNARDLTGSTIQTQSLTDGKWSAADRLEVRYDYALESPKGYCAKDSTDCAELTSLANSYATRYDRTRIPEVLATSLSDKEKASYVAMQGIDKNEQPHSLPMFDQPNDGSYSDFADGALTFPVRWHGEVLLGRIGRDGMGWRIGDDWLVGFWRQEGGALKPLAGIRVPVKRTTWLHSTVIP